MVQKLDGAQNDFSYGEIDVALKRSDNHPARKAGLRQFKNARILNSGAFQNRSGRRALYPCTNSPKRTERITMSPGNVFDIQFAAARVKIINSAGATVANFTTRIGGAALPWTADNLNSIVYAILNKSIYITFTGMVPQVLTWDGVSTWAISDYAELVTQGGQKRTPFYRISPPSVTLQPSATTGNINILFSSPIAVAGMVGTRIRYCGRQLVLTLLNTPSSMQATVAETLPPAQVITPLAITGGLSIGDVVLGSVSGAKGIVTAVPTSQALTFSSATNPLTYQVGDAITGGTSGATGTVTSCWQPWASSGDYTVYMTVYLSTATLFLAGETVTGPHGSAVSLTATAGSGYIVQLIQNNSALNVFTTADKMVGPSGSTTISGVATTTPQAVALWEDEVINSYRGYPQSVFVDQSRLGFCNFPGTPGGIAWSAINTPNDLFVDAATAGSAIFEIAPHKTQVYYVLPGPEGSEFVFCDSRVYYIKIDISNPLRPGSVNFQNLSGDGSAQVQPRVAQSVILYVSAGQNSVMAILASGAYYRPFNTKNLCEFHGHLFTTIKAIAVPNADGSFGERYAYVLNTDGSVVIGKYDLDDIGAATPKIGWGPHTGNATVNWIASSGADVIFTSTYFSADVLEVLDDAQYLDCAMAVNSAPAAFAPPLGKGPLWYIPSQTVTLIDQGTRFMGTYQIDANGFIVPQFNGNEDLTRSTLIAGQPWTLIAEPFAPEAQPGADMGQRVRKRRVTRVAAHVVNSTGFYLARLFSGPLTPTSPALGTVQGTFRVPAWNIDDNATLPPPQREGAVRWRPTGRYFDPRIALIKDTPGPLMVTELGMEATV